MPVHASAVAQRLHTKTTAWRALENHCRKIHNLDLKHLFADDPGRGDRMAAQGAGLYLDYSKNRITDNTLSLLIHLAEESGLHARIDAMFRGEKINITENLPVLHIALRTPRGATIFVDGENVVPKVHNALDKMMQFCKCVRNGEWRGYTGKPIRNIVNVGTGGFDLGPVMAYESLKAYSERSLTFRFISNIDGSDFVEAVRDLEPSETLFIVCLGNSTHSATLTNALSARAWILSTFGGDKRSLANHFVAVAANPQQAEVLEIGSANVFQTWPWVGERFSIGSAIGLSTMLAIGPDHFREMLDGCHQMDRHFLATPFAQNLPVILGLLTVWYVDFFHTQTIAVLPYNHYLKRFPSFVQQLMMGSSGKHVTLIGTEVTQATGPIYWGEPGTNGQQSFYQFLYQGTGLVPCDFIAFGKSSNPIACHQDMLLANAFAHSGTLAFGKSVEEVRAEGSPEWLASHRAIKGNVPSNTIMAEQLTPETLGKLIALYEHSVFTQGVIWNINSFDKWGATVGDAFAELILPELESNEEPLLAHDSSTNALIRRYRKLKLTA